MGKSTFARVIKSSIKLVIVEGFIRSDFGMLLRA